MPHHAALLELYTTAAEAALRSAHRFHVARATIGQLGTALDSRAVIDQAKGILMALHRISADQAFDLLVTNRSSKTLSCVESPNVSSPTSSTTEADPRRPGSPSGSERSRR